MRCRPRAIQITSAARFDVFAGTAPLKFVRLLSLAAARRPGNEDKPRFLGLRLGLHLVPPKCEDHPGVVWQLKRAMYGARVASKNVQDRARWRVHPFQGQFHGSLEERTSNTDRGAR